MNIVHDADQVLRDLISFAEVAAKHSMEKTGSFPPTIFIDGIEGRVTYSPPARFLRVCQDDLAEIARECCVAYGAVAVVIAGEGWKVKNPIQRDSKVPNERLLNADDREEVVAFIGQTRYEKLNRVRPIIRSERGNFLGLGEGVCLQDSGAYIQDPDMLGTGFPDKECRGELKAELRKDGHRIDRAAWREGRRRGMELGM